MSARHVFPSPRRLTIAVALVLLTASTLLACDTPVYRYAMYRWAPETYSVYCLHDGAPTAEQQAVLDRFEKLQFGDAGDTLDAESVNVDIASLDTGAGDPATQLPASVHAAWQEEGGTVPTFIVMAPGGRLLHAGPLTVDDVDALVDSPARRDAARLLDVDHVAVFLLLESDDAAANESAERSIRDVIDLAEAGAISADDPLAGALASDGDDDATLLLATVKLSRDNPAERWLVRMLLDVEPDLDKFSEPMIFPVFGRGRALEPFIGQGITVDNLSGAVAYISGSCSCEIKEQNPGMDLLTRWNWEGTAADLAERVGEEEGNRGLLSPTELFPTIIVATNNDVHAAGADEFDSPGATTAASDTAEADTTEADTTEADSTEPEAMLVAAVPTDEQSHNTTVATVAAEDAPSDTNDSLATTATGDDSAASDRIVSAQKVIVATDGAASETGAHASSAFQQRWTHNLMLGGGLAVLLTVVFSLAMVKSRA
ncbi:MAG: hypothetical protein R3C10_11440 [Pirellulales bacterium]